jgi:uncharacterized cupin superfamily protein
MEEGVTFGQLDLEGGEMFQAVRRGLGVTTFGINVITLQPLQRLRIHRHHHQEEVYLVLAGTLALLIEAEEHELVVGGVARVAPTVRRQLTNRGPATCVVLALGGSAPHEGRDGEAFVSWDDESGKPPQEIPLPPDLPD